MYAVIRRYTVKPGGARQLADRVEREFLPILKSVPGFVNYMYMEGGQEFGRDILATVSIFDNRAGAELSVQTAAQWVGDNLGAYEPSQPTIVAGEILSSAGIVKSPAYSP